MSDAQRRVYRLLSGSYGLKQKEIIEQLAMPPRTVRHALGALRQARIIVAYLGEDLRAPVFALAGKGAGT